MKKSVLAALAAVMLLSGCSGVSQDEYNSLLEENSKLKESSRSENTSSEISTIETSTSGSIESSNSFESNKPNENESLSTDSNISADDPSAILKEMIDKGEAIISPVTGTVWFYLEDNSAYVASVGNGIFAEANDEKKIGYCYLDAIYFASNEQFKDKYWMYLYWFDPNIGDGNTLGYCTITNLFGETSISDNSIKWTNEWEQFNESDTNKKYIELVKNYDFSIVTDNFELGGYKVDFTGEYNFVVLDNKFSAYNGQTLLTVNADIKNLSNDYDSKGYSYCTLSCQASAPDGSRLSSFDTYLGDNGILGSKIFVGQTFNGNFAVPYVGDGEYRFEFTSLGDNRKYVYKIDVIKP